VARDGQLISMLLQIWKCLKKGAASLEKPFSIERSEIFFTEVAVEELEGSQRTLVASKPLFLAKSKKGGSWERRKGPFSVGKRSQLMKKEADKAIG